MTLNAIVEEVLREPKDAIRYTLSARLAEAFPDLALVETTDCSFDLDEFSRAGLCSMNVAGKPHPQSEFAWYGDRNYERSTNQWLHVQWEGHRFDVVVLSYMGTRYGDEQRTYIVGPRKEIVLSFFDVVCAWNNEIRGEILVYHGSGWHKSAELYESIRGTSYEDVILAGAMVSDIRSDLERFLKQQSVYDAYKIPWKRGVLFLGPPGNGKTQMIKAIANGLGIPVLYVRSLKSEYGTEHDSIRKVFERARTSAPCLLVLEDIDSLIHAGNRSFFLNELDGFSANTGIVTLASANYPEKLDPAILDRPSRFDRKYHFELPGIEERSRYIRLWNQRLEPDLRLSEQGIETVARATEEFSYAYIKELFLSGMMQWIDENGATQMHDVLCALTMPLRAQMRSGLDAQGVSDVQEDEEDSDGELPAAMRMAQRMRKR